MVALIDVSVNSESVSYFSITHPQLNIGKAVGCFFEVDSTNNILITTEDPTGFFYYDWATASITGGYIFKRGGVTDYESKWVPNNRLNVN